MVALGLRLARLGPPSRGAQSLRQQADERALYKEHEKWYRSRGERVLRTEEQVVGGQAGQDHRQQARTQAPVPRAHHHGPEEQQERNVLRDHGVQEKLDPHRHPDDQDGNAVSQERRGAFYRVHLGPVPVERAGASPTCGRAALPSMASACNHSTILRPCEVSGIPHLRYFRRSIVPRSRKPLQEAVQSSIWRPDTRSNSRVLLVTSVAPRLRAWAAMRVSSGPMGMPRSSREARTRP